MCQHSLHQCTSEFHTHHPKYSPNLCKYTTHHLGIYVTLYSYHPKIPEYLYCKRSCIGTCSSIHLIPSIWPFCSQPLKFSINFRSIAKDSYSPPQFSEINRYLIFFLTFSFLYTFLFILLLHFSFSSYFFYV